MWPFGLGRITTTLTLLLEAHFYKIKKRAALGRSHKDLNTTDDNMGLAGNFSASTELCNA
jgi:hypothetical protein